MLFSCSSFFCCATNRVGMPGMPQSSFLLAKSSGARRKSITATPTTVATCRTRWRDQDISYNNTRYGDIGRIIVNQQGLTGGDIGELNGVAVQLVPSIYKARRLLPLNIAGFPSVPMRQVTRRSANQQINRSTEYVPAIWATHDRCTSQ